MSLLAPGVARPERPAGGAGEGSGEGREDPLGSDRGPVVGLWWGVIWFAAGALLGSHALSDNSFLTHLATGRLIRSGGVPSVDPYSFLAMGRPWVVQSWFASWLYAAAEGAAGLWAVRMVMVCATGLLCALLWRLSARAGDLLPRLVITGVAVAYGSSWWSERPQLLGFCLLALTLLVLEEQWSSWWLLPAFAVWVNVHGSFPVGLVIVVMWSVAGWSRSREPRAGDRRRSDVRPRRLALEPVGTALLGCALGGLLSPFGLQQLTFPVNLLGRRDVLRYIVEWRQPSLVDPSTWVFAAIVVTAVWLVARRRAWWALPPVIVVAGLGVMSERNIAIGMVVLVPLLSAVMPRFGSFGAATPPRPRNLVLGIAAVLVGAGAVVGMTPDLDLGPYPVRAVEWMHVRGMVATPSVRVVSPDYVGNYLALRYGDDANLYLDDRAEIFTAAELGGYIDLLTATHWSGVLRSLDADVVLWPTDLPLARRIAASPEWEIGYRDLGWIVACRTDGLIDCGGS